MRAFLYLRRIILGTVCAVGGPRCWKSQRAHHIISDLLGCVGVVVQVLGSDCGVSVPKPNECGKGVADQPQLKNSLSAWVAIIWLNLTPFEIPDQSASTNSLPHGPTLRVGFEHVNGLRVLYA